jgi:hypothetical protein
MEIWWGARPRSAQARPTTTAETAARCAPNPSNPSNPSARSGEAISAVIYFLHQLYYYDVQIGKT